MKVLTIFIFKAKIRRILRFKFPRSFWRHVLKWTPFLIETLKLPRLTWETRHLVTYEKIRNTASYKINNINNIF